MLTAGTVPVITRSVSVSPPAAAATFFSPATELTFAAVRLPRPNAVRLSMWILDPAAGRVLVPTLPPAENPNPVPDPAAGDLVTVMSVPTPYSECSTVPWAFLTPVAAAVTVITSPMPRARPRAMKADCRIRRRSSRRR